jgi:enoyl-CoA hydratase/carnithine racemase
MNEHPPTQEESILFDRDGAIATITLNRPAKMNALDGDAWALLDSILETVQNDDSVRVVILAGAGDNFCAGADVSAPRTANAHPLRRMRSITDVVQRLFELPVATIARVDGVAVGAGWNIALACDFVIASDRSRFSQIFGRRGLSADCGGSWLLPRIVGPQVAKRLLYLAEMIPASEAAELGLVLEFCSIEQLEQTVIEFASRLATVAPVALAQNKALLNSSWTSTFAEQLIRENTAQVVNFGTDGAVARAALAKGENPHFEGKWQL